MTNDEFSENKKNKGLTQTRDNVFIWYPHAHTALTTLTHVAVKSAFWLHN